jgi:hypothetical protein
MVDHDYVKTMQIAEAGWVNVVRIGWMSHPNRRSSLLCRGEAQDSDQNV